MAAKEAIQTTMTVTYNGGPYEVLQDLIRLRGKWFGEQARNSSIACMIDVCRSLRADTRTAAFRNKAKIEPTGLFAFYNSGERRWQITADWKQRGKAKVSDARIKFVELHGVKARNAHVYHCVDEQGREFYVAAKSEAVAKRIIKAAAKERIKKYRGLAKNALLVCIGKLASNSKDKAGKLGSEAEKKSSRLAEVRVTDTNKGTSVYMSSGIDYGRLALKSGSTDLAMKKAANKIAGMLQRAAKSHSFQVKAPPTPFPEIRRRRA